jgi:trk system potassium uptake protein TrkA
MNVVIMGCGRVGARLASLLHSEGHDVTVLDTNPNAFRRLPPSYGGKRIVGNGMDQRALESAGIERADAFVAVTQGDNRNIFGSELAREIYRVPRVICRIYDPGREEIFRDLGLETFSPTSLGAKVMHEMLLRDSGG